MITLRFHFCSRSLQRTFWSSAFSSTSAGLAAFGMYAGILVIVCMSSFFPLIGCLQHLLNFCGYIRDHVCEFLLLFLQLYLFARWLPPTPVRFLQVQVLDAHIQQLDYIFSWSCFLQLFFFIESLPLGDTFTHLCSNSKCCQVPHKVMNIFELQLRSKNCAMTPRSLRWPIWNSQSALLNLSGNCTQRMQSSQAFSNRSALGWCVFGWTPNKSCNSILAFHTRWKTKSESESFVCPERGQHFIHKLPRREWIWYREAEWHASLFN